MLFRRLCLCLLALALLPGAPVQAHMAMAAGMERTAPAGVTAPTLADADADADADARSGCHEAMAAPAVTGSMAADADRTMHSPDCCADAAGGPPSGDGCPCPPATATALPPPLPTLRATTPGRHWGMLRFAGHTGPGHAPPRRPPIA